MKGDMPIVSIGFDGYDLENTLKGLSKTKSKNIILCCIDGFTKHVVPEEMSEKAWQQSKKLMEENGLHFYGLFGHCNLSDEKDLQKLRKRMRYTRYMGGSYIDTNAGPKGQEKGFFNNLPEIIGLAEELDLVVCLETHGDMLETGEMASKIFEKINSQRIRLSYDPANVYFYTRGRVDPNRDVQFIFDHIGMLHFKGVSFDAGDNRWSFPLVKGADIDYGTFFNALRKLDYRHMVAIELESRFHFEEEQGFTIDAVWPEEKVIEAYNEEIDHLTSRLDWIEI
jgi:sugar phosphate isomerase/epimerase